jgi:potassium voltage-gated channel Eag-related subfamily H protein 7
VAFLESGYDTANKMGLFLFNRIVDLVFTVDLVKSFFTPYLNAQYGEWVTSIPQISKRYLKGGQIIRNRAIALHYMLFFVGWFPVDFVSILPFDTVGAVVQSDAVSQMKAARVVRLFRLLKLLRLVRGMRLIQKWQDSMGMLHVHKQLLSFLVLMVTAAHWIACLWRLTPDIDQITTAEGDKFNWMTHYKTGGAGQYVSEQTPDVQYAAALYWSVMTLTVSKTLIKSQLLYELLLADYWVWRC